MPNDLTSRIRARITPENAALLDVRARALGKSNSRVINDALSASFTFEHDDQRDARILEKLEMMIRHNHRHSRDLNLHSETFALFLHFYFTMAPQISAADSEVRAARGVGLMNQFIDQLGAKMKMGGKTFKQALSDVLVSDQDFFRLDEIQLLQKLQKTRKPVPKKKETADV
jgi:hypothetical protein